MEGVEYASPEVAHCYASGRALTADVLDGWKTAVEEFLPPGQESEVVLDLGAGTGIFARAWSTWRRCQVIAVEPSPAMRVEMVRGGLIDTVHVLGASAEYLPLQVGSIDVGWLSAVIHHLVDLEQSARELRRVVRDGGVVLVRGLFADSAVPSGLRFLPGSRRALSSFPSTAALAEVYRAAGFQLIGRRDVTDHGPSTVAEASRWIGRLRGADSFLASLTNEEIEAGLAVMKEQDPEELLPSSTLTLLAFTDLHREPGGPRPDL